MLKTQDKSSSDNITSFNLDVCDNPYIMAPQPTESPPLPPSLQLIVVGYKPRKVGRDILQLNPRPNANPDLQMLD